jgi:hypothetical protein
MPSEAAPPAAVESRSYNATIDDISTQRRTVTAKINTSGVDRYRTVICPGGGDFRAFMRSPAVLWEHGQDPSRGRIPVGHCTSIKYRKAEDDILAVTRFKSDPYSDEIFNDYASGVLTAFSVDFLPDMARSSRPTAAEVRDRPDWKSADMIFRGWELTGYSAVSYPGNAEALATAVERGLWVPDVIRDAILAQKTGRAMAEGSGAAGGYATGTGDPSAVKPKGTCRVCREGERHVVRDEDDAEQGDYDSEDDARAACDEYNGVRKEAPGRTAPTLTTADLAHLAGLRTYTATELAGIVARSVADPLLAATAAAIQDARDLARGRI